MARDFLGVLNASQILDALEGVTYLTDLDGVVRVIGRSSWNVFASANDTPELRPEVVVGAPLFDMIAGEEVREAYRAMHRAVVSGARPRACFNFRCDSPDAERWMRMSIGLIRGDRGAGVLYQSQLLRSELRPSIALFSRELLTEGLMDEASRPILSMCSYCQQVAQGAGPERRWIEATAYYSEGGSSEVRVSHAICPACMVEVVEPNIQAA